MQFRFSELKNKIEITKEETASTQDLFWNPPENARFDKEVAVKAKAKMIQSDILVTADVKTTVHFRCVRCLNDFSRTLTVQVHQNYPIDQDTINIDNEIRESVLIELPIHPVCRRDCRGLTSTSNPDDRADHRWDALKNIQ